MEHVWIQGSRFEKSSTRLKVDGDLCDFLEVDWSEEIQEGGTLRARTRRVYVPGPVFLVAGWREAHGILEAKLPNMKSFPIEVEYLLENDEPMKVEIGECRILEHRNVLNGVCLRMSCLSIVTNGLTLYKDLF